MGSEKKKAYDRAYQRKHAEEKKKYLNVWYRENAERERAKLRAARVAEPERFRATDQRRMPRHSETNRERRARYRAEGRCIDCGSPAPNGLCERHHAARLAASAAYRARKGGK